jgi:plastocyanin
MAGEVDSLIHARRIAFLTSLIALTVGCARGGQPSGTVVMVTAKEFSFELSPATVGPGAVTFRVQNRGAVEHNFALFQGTQKLAELNTFNPGETRELRIQLTRGEYRIVCTIPGHEAAGMVTALKVGP